jgi:hypothetical protein
MPVSYSLFSNAGWQFFDNNGNILSGGKLYTYVAGTSTPLTTYTSSAGTTANTNPIVLDSSGRITQEIWVNNTATSKFVLKTSADVLLATWDNIPSLSTALNGTGVNNGVLYFSSTGVLTSGTALTFDGSNLTTAGGITAGTSLAVGTNATIGGSATVTGTIASTAGITSATPAVTQGASDSSTKIATTSFVKQYAPSAKIQTINAVAASNQLTITLNPTYLDFRATPVSSNTVTSINIPSALTLTVPFGVTLGMTGSVSARLVVLAVLNGSTPQLAVTNLLGGNQLDETNLISTITTGATTAAVFSSSIVTGPYRVVGFIDITQATPGTWVSQPTTIQGAGGQALQSITGGGITAGVNMAIFNTSGSWTVPSGITKAFVWVVGAAGGGITFGASSKSGGSGGTIQAWVTGLTGSVTITVGTGGAGALLTASGQNAGSGGLSSFGSYLSATGGTGGNSFGGTANNGTNGVGTITTGTRINFGSINGSPTTAGGASGQGNTTWLTTYTEQPGTAFSGVVNGMGGAVLIQY